MKQKYAYKRASAKIMHCTCIFINWVCVCIYIYIYTEAFKGFNHSSIFDKVAFCLGEKQGMLINGECSSWYNRVGNFVMSVWKGIL